MDDTDFQIPEDVKQALLAHPMHKVAGALYGVDFSDKREVFHALGEKLAMALLERSAINSGIRTLGELQKEAYFLIDDIAGGVMGYNNGKRQSERGEPYSFGLPQLGSLILPGGTPYQIARGLGHAAAGSEREQAERAIRGEVPLRGSPQPAEQGA